MNDERGNWYLLTGLVIGVVLGLIYAWQIRPLQYSETSPVMLNPEYKEQYRVLIASAYLANNDLVRAEARLRLLNDKDPIQALTEQAERTLANGGDAEAAVALGMLAVDLGGGKKPAEEPESPSVTAGATEEMEPIPASPTPQPQAAEEQTTPEHTPTTAVSRELVLEERQPVCDPNLIEALVQIQVEDSEGQPLPGLELIVSWSTGQETIFTGLKPELGSGYADFTIVQGETYTVQAAQGGELVGDLTVQQCETQGGSAYEGGWLLCFRQP